jgi:hypothetical protein
LRTPDRRNASERAPPHSQSDDARKTTPTTVKKRLWGARASLLRRGDAETIALRYANYCAGTRRFTSSYQFSTTLMLGTGVDSAGRELSSGTDDRRA